jgi:hypothetical protein
MTENNTESAQVKTQRQVGEEHFMLAVSQLEAAQRAQAENSSTEELTRLGWATTLLLKALYNEVRHGNDLKEEELDDLAAHTKALNEHADEMDNLGKALRFQGDVTSFRR